MKIVYFARHYPPIISGAGRRLAGLAAGLRAAGADVFIVAPLLDNETRGMAVPHPQPVAEIGSGHSNSPLKDFLRHWARIPDADVKWAKQAAKAFLDAAPFTPDWVITSTPPESSLLFGQTVKAATGARWASDFRDHWLVRPHLESREQWLRKTLEKHWARKVLRTLDLGFAVNSQIQHEYAAYTQAPVSVLPHFTLLQDTAPYKFTPGYIHLVHTGRFSLSDPNCSITPLLQAFETARHAAPDLRLHLVGALSLEEQSEVAASSQSAAIELHGVVSPSQAVAMQKDSDGLVLVAAPDATVVPSKIVEYQAAQRPILLVGSPRLRASTPGQELSVTDQMLALAKSQLAVLVDDMPATHLEAGQWVFDQLRSFRDKACPAKPLSETDGNGS